MDDVDDLMEQLRRSGVELRLVDDRLEVELPFDEVDDALLRRLDDQVEQVTARRRASAAVTAPRMLSFAQQRLWFIDRLEGGSTQYNQPIALRLRGRVDAGALARAFAAVCERHATLRTRFVVVDGQPVCDVMPACVHGFEEIDLSTQPPAYRDARVIALAEAEAHTPFDLARDAMIRVRLLRCAEDDAVLLVTLHHVAADGWSIGVFVREFAQHYEAARRGHAAALAPLEWDYADYARWQRGRLQGDQQARLHAYWREQLRDIPAAHALPLDHPRPAQQAFEASVLEVPIAPALHAALQETASEHRVTPFMLLYAVFTTLLHRRSGQDDIVVGVPSAGRTHVALEPMIGLFVNTLVMRSRPRAGLPFSELLAQTRDMALGAFEHQEMPFDMLVDLLKPRRSRSHGPIFQLMFSFQDSHVSRIALPDVELELLPSEFRRTKCDLELEISESAVGLTARWVCASGLFETASVQRMADEFVHLLEAAVRAPATALAALPMLPESEVRTLAEWNRTDVPFPAGETLLSRFEARASDAPQRIALVLDDAEWTYSQLNARANRLARLLVDRHGVDVDVRVGLCLERSLEMVVALLAIMKAGGAYVALDPALPPERLAFMLDDSGAQLALTARFHVDRLAGAQRCIALVIEPGVDGGFPDHDLPPRARADSLAYVIYTSGSTGQPKGTLNLHRGPCNRIHALQSQFRLQPHDRVLHKTPLSFDVSVWELFWPWWEGAAVVLARLEGHKDPRYLLETIVAQRVSVVHFVPSMLQMFLRALRGQALPGLRYVMTSGEALTRELQAHSIEAFPGARLVNHYGPTETGIEVSWWPFDRLRDDGLVPIGRPIANNRLYILDDAGRQLPIGVAGELHIAGVQVGEGYIGNPALSAQCFVTLAPAGVPERMYKTGDLARWLHDGQIQYVGRIDNQIKLRGMRVELGEIEGRLRAHPGVEEVVVGVEGELAHQRLVCYLVRAEGVAAELGAFVSELRSTLAQSMPSYMSQCRYVVLERIPLSPNGKIDRLALATAPTLRAPENLVVEPADDLERALLRIWMRRLEAQPGSIGVHDNFFEVGGNSMMTIAVQADIAAELRLEVAISELFQNPTIQHLARFLSGRAPTRQARTATLREGRERILKARARANRPS